MRISDGSADVCSSDLLEDIARAIDPRLADTEDDIDTIGGLAATLAGHVPQAGECLEHVSGWTLEVIEADPRRVARLRLHPPARQAEEEEARSEEHTSELQSLMRISYAVFCLKKKKQQSKRRKTTQKSNEHYIKIQ